MTIGHVGQVKHVRADAPAAQSPRWWTAIPRSFRTESDRLGVLRSKSIPSFMFNGRTMKACMGLILTDQPRERRRSVGSRCCCSCPAPPPVALRPIQSARFGSSASTLTAESPLRRSGTWARNDAGHGRCPGADVIAAEATLKRGAVRLVLTREPDDFASASVALPATDCEERFRASSAGRTLRSSAPPTIGRCRANDRYRARAKSTNARTS